MNRKQFIAELWELIPSTVSTLEKSVLVDYYDEMIKEYVADGYSEEEAVLMMDAPEEIVANEGLIPQAPRKTISWVMILLLVIGFPLWGSIVLTLVLLAFTAYLLIWTPLLVTGSLGVGFGGGGIAAMFVSIFALQDGLGIAVTQFGMGMIFFAVGILLSLLTIKFSGTILKATGQVTMFLVRSIRKGVTGYAL